MDILKYLILGAVLCLASCSSLAPPAVAPVEFTITALAPSATATLAPTATPTATTVPTSLPPTEVLPPPATSKVEPGAVFTLTVVYDNVVVDAQLQADWGFACVVRGPEQVLLFDTGRNGDVLLENMRVAGLDPHAVNTVVLSHAHNDHTGGLLRFLEDNPYVTVVVLESFPAGLKTSVRMTGATLVEVTGTLALNPWVHSTGDLGGTIPEQALVLDTPRGAVVISGCAHHGIATAVRQARGLLDSDIALVLGGFHLLEADTAQIAAVIADLQVLGVQTIAPSHCTGSKAMAAFAEAFGAAYLTSGVGRNILITAEAEP